MGRRSVPPKASALIESLRGLGYSPDTAHSDIIDNNIAAGTRNVDLRFQRGSDETWIVALDDGREMTAAELDAAMRLGHRNPLETRASQDPVRFGLGLKTASFSQGRRLTVLSRTVGHQAECLRWGLNLLSVPGDEGWHLLEGPGPGSESRLAGLRDQQSGTIVLLEKLDRKVAPGFDSDDLVELIYNVERDLAVTFYRYLENPAPRLRLKINGTAVVPWDAFMPGHPSNPWV